jgi:hypothetical protein
MHERTVDLHCGDNRMFVLDIITNKAETVILSDVSHIKLSPNTFRVAEPGEEN